MKTSRVIARARKGIPAIRAPREQQARRLSSTTLSSASTSRTLRRQPKLSSHPIPISSSTTVHLQARRSYADARETDEPLRKTPLYDLHVKHGAKMVPFGGYHMPVKYADQSVIESHLWTRSHSSLFDVGHMVQHRFGGAGATAFLQRVTPAGLEGLAPQHSTLSAFLHPGTGGIVDDTIVAKLDDGSYYVVTNAGCREKDLAYLERELGKWRDEGRPPVQHKVMEGQGLIALQGPSSAQAIADLLEPHTGAQLPSLLFGMVWSVKLRIFSSKEEKEKEEGGYYVVEDVLLSRGGYTGEDGFEISIPPQHTAAAVSQLLLENSSSSSKEVKVKLAGLGARDSLRLEAGMCLYGHDIDDSTTPAEAGLGWIVAKERRQAETDGAFYGADVILAQLTPKSKGGAGVERRRVGLVVDGAPAREGATILAGAGGGEAVGRVTSGCPSPSLGKNIAMGYVRDGLHKAGTELKVVVRNKERDAVVTRMPFVQTKYWRGLVP